MAIENEELVEKAEELELKVEDFETEEELQGAIDKKLEDELEADPDKLKEKIEFQKSEARKAFEARDKAKKERLRLSKKYDEQAKELKNLQSKLESAPSADEYNDLKVKLDEILEKEENAKLDKLDDSEKERVRFEKQLDAFEKKFDATTEKFNDQLKEKDDELKQSKQEIRDLRRVKLNSEILEHAVAGNAYNPKQIVKILTSDFQYDDKLETHTHLVREKGKIVDELSVEERVKAFLEDPDNDNLVRSGAKGGTGTKEVASSASTKNVTEKNTGYFPTSKLGKKPGEYSPKDPDLIKEAELKGLTVEEHIDILKMRDAKMSKIPPILR
jgi:hypothetical protein